MTDGKSLSRMQVRLVLLGLCTSLGFFATSARLAYLTIVARDSLREKGAMQHLQTLKLDPRRGSILDRNGHALATSVEVESIYAVPRAFSPEQVSQASRALGECLDAPPRRVASRLEGGKSFVWIERKATADKAQCVRELNLVGTGFVPESQRFYPKRRLASQVLGYVGIDNEGMAGVEYAFDDEIQGEPGRRIIWIDALRRRAASRVEEGAEPGRSVYLTLDENLQYIAETEITAAVEESRSASGIAILMRPRTGELLAMAAWPSFNPNRYTDFPESHWRNRAVTDVYEPGSTFKIIGAAAALEEGVVTEDERIDCGSGSIQIANRIIGDHRPFDVLTFREVIEKSSNIGMIRIGQRLGKERFESYIRAFGFGEPTGVELPAESRGILRPASRWGAASLASIAFGQEISVTPLQMVAAVNVVANRGVLMRPTLLLGRDRSDGTFQENLAPEPVRRVISEETARHLTSFLEGVVERGTGRRAAVTGIRVAGKTGTAQKAIRGGYSRTDYIASFVGFAPAEDPEITALVILDSPNGDHSGSRAAAVFGRIIERSLRYLGVPRENEALVRLATVWPQRRPILDGETKVIGVSGRVDEVPDVVGLPARDALARFVTSGLVPVIEGSGFVVEQHPLAGAIAVAGEAARLVLGARPIEGRELFGVPPARDPRVASVHREMFGPSPE
ncbi:MAG TPA: penicillin-binding transpeptidase domain-containing protein [Vicinamibacteria bacterium]|nr:penicillin-binding transpeptidase domain-containing protein [Vicinamibacteria bacterium]